MNSDDRLKRMIFKSRRNKPKKIPALQLNVNKYGDKEKDTILNQKTSYQDGKIKDLIFSSNNPNMSRREKPVGCSPFNSLNIYKTNDNIYLDIVQRNLTSDEPLIFNFKEIRNEIIVDNPSNYYLSVARFSIPSFYIPIAIYLPQTGGSFNELSQWSFTIEFIDGVGVTEKQRVFVPIFQNGLFPIDTLQNKIITYTDYNNPYLYIYNPQTLVDSMNRALQLAFDAITLTKPVDSEPPYITYNLIQRTFTLNAQRTHYEIGGGAPLNKFIIYMNYELSYVLTSFDVTYWNTTFFPAIDGTDVAFAISDISNNSVQIPNQDPTSFVYPPTILQNKQQFSSLANLNPVRSFIFTTYTIPINKEFTQVAPNIVNNEVNNSRDAFTPILTDFEIDRSAQSLDFRGNYQYNTTGEYRLVDLVNTQPLKTIDLRINWLDVYGNISPVLIRKGDLVSVKLIFIKRSLKKNFTKIYE